VRRLLVPVLLSALTACIGSARPRTESRGSRTTTSIDEVPIRGWNVDVDLDTHGRVQGELLAVDEVDIYVLTQWDKNQGTVPYRIPRAWVQHIDVLTGETSPLPTTGAVLGLLSTPTHGWFLVLSAPVWIITLGAVAPSEAARGTLRFEPPLSGVGTYARFPQGPPPLLRPPPAAAPGPNAWPSASPNPLEIPHAGSGGEPSPPMPPSPPTPPVQIGGGDGG
jgi:hypothetical protein